MFHKAIKLTYREGTVLEVRFDDGLVKQYDVSVLFAKYPAMEELRNRSLFLSGKLMGYYGIIWNEELDLETETIYEEGRTIRKGKPAPYRETGEAVMALRAERSLSQKELSLLTGIDQSDLSRIEKGTANVSIKTLSRIAEALDAEMKIVFEKKEEE